MKMRYATDKRFWAASCLGSVLVGIALYCHAGAPASDSLLILAARGEEKDTFLLQYSVDAPETEAWTAKGKHSKDTTVVAIERDGALLWEMVHQGAKGREAAWNTDFVLRQRRLNDDRSTPVLSSERIEQALRADGWEPPPGPRRRPLVEGIQIALDRQSIAFVHARPELDASDLWIYDMLKGVFTKISGGDHYDEMPVWSPDSIRLAFYRTPSRVGHGWGTGETTHPAYALLTWDSQTREAKQIAAPGAYADWGRRSPVWSPDGSGILFQTAQRMWTEPLGLYIVPASGGEPRCLSAQTGSSRGSVAAFSFSPDSRQVVYVCDGKVFVVTIESGERKPILPDGTYSFAQWGGQGNRIILSDTRSQWFLARPDGSDLRPIASPPGYRVLRIYTCQD